MGKLLIYDEKTLLKYLRLKRLQVLAIFAAGSLCGLWLANSNLGVAFAAAPAAKVVAFNPRASWCGNQSANTISLRMDCELKSFSR
jgi:uncharacterized membrane protein